MFHKLTVIFTLAVLFGAGALGEEDDELPVTPLDDFRASTSPAMLGLYDLTNWFLDHAVQPRTLGYFLDADITIDDVIKGAEDAKFWEENWQVFTGYTWGYVTIIVISVVTLLGMLLAAFLVPCCRCCTCCGGGKRKPREHARDKERAYHRGCCFAWMALFLVGCLLGVASMFALSGELKNVISGDESVFNQISEGSSQIQPFLLSSVRDVNTTLYGGAVTTTDDVFDILSAIPNDAIDAVNEATGIDATVNELSKFAGNLHLIDSTLQNATLVADNLDSEVSLLVPSVSDSKVAILAAILACTTPECNTTRTEVEQLEVILNANAIFITIQALARSIEQTLNSEFLNNTELISEEINKIIAEVENTINTELESGRKTVDEEVLDKLKTTLTDVYKQVKDFNITVVEEAMDEVQSAVEDNNIQMYVYWAFIGLASIILLIVTLALIGSVHIFCSPRMSNDKDCCHTDRANGADWLFAATGFIFIFFWMLLIVTMTMFVTGGMTHTELCRYVVHPDAEQFQDARTVINNVASAIVTDNTDFDMASLNITLFEAYANCGQNEALYSALNLADNGFDVRELVKEPMDELTRLVEELKAIHIDVPEVDFLPDTLVEQLDLLEEAFAKAGLTELIIELSGDITQPADLAQLAANLTNIKGEPGVEEADLQVQIDLLNHYAGIVTTANVYKQALLVEVTAVNDLIGDISFSGIVDALNNSQIVINTQGDDIIGGIVNSTADDSLKVFEQFIDASIVDLETSIAQCFPLYSSAATMINAGCVSALYPINGMAYALGWSLFFLLLVLIIAFKMADHMRREVRAKVEPENAHRSIMDYNSHISESDTLPIATVGGRGVYDPSGMPAMVNPAYMAEHEMAAAAYKIPHAHMTSPYSAAPGYSPPPAYGAYTQGQVDYKQGRGAYGPGQTSSSQGHGAYPSAKPPGYDARGPPRGGAKVMLPFDDPNPDY